MVRPGLAALVLIALAVPAGAASDLPRRIGMYPQQGQPLAMLDSDVLVRVRGPIVEATITQTFRNDTDRVTEATYIFPLPPDAAVSAMEIETGSRTIRAAIEAREQAVQRYERAVAAGIGAGLLEQERPDVFTQTVSAIPARGTVKVTLRFDTVARYHAGTWELALPLVVAPRYVAGSASGRPTTGTGRAPDTDRAPDASRVTPGGAPGAGGATQVTLELADGMSDVTSPTHELTAANGGYTFTDPKTDHDAIVRWRARTQTQAWVEGDDTGGFAAVLVEAKPASVRKTAVRVALVVDHAATVRGDAEAVQRPVVRSLLGALDAKDSVALADGKLVFGSAQAAQRSFEERTRTTAPFDLTSVLGSVRGDHAVVLVTDGLVADDRAAIAAATKIGKPVHVIGIGPAPNRGLLAQVAAVSGGTIRFAVVGDDLAALARDVLADATSQPDRIAITWGTLAVSDLVPQVLPRLGAGQAILVVGKVKKAQAANARVRGDVLGFTQVTTPPPPDGATTAHGALGRRWAKQRLDELLAAGNTRAITDHALRYGLVSPATAMVAIGDEVIVKGGVKHTVAVPVSVPAGMQWQLVKQQTTVDTTKASGGEAMNVADKKEKAKPDKPDTYGKTQPAKPAKPAEKPTAKNERKPVADRPGRTPVAAREDRKPVVVGRERRVPVAAGPSAGAVSPPPPPPSPIGDSSGSPSPRDKGEDAPAAADDLQPTETPMREASPAPEVAAMGDYDDDNEADEVIGSELASTSVGRKLRLSLSLGGGLYVQGSEQGALGAVGARVEMGRRTRFGLEASLWFVDGWNAQGSLLSSVSRRVSRRLELAGGVGLHITGDAVGPALDLRLRTLLPVRGLATYLRYDGALLRRDDAFSGQNAGSFGIEASW